MTIAQPLARYAAWRRFDTMTLAAGMDAFNHDATDDADKPYTLPAAVTLASRCESRAWDDDTDDESQLSFSNHSSPTASPKPGMNPGTFVRF